MPFERISIWGLGLMGGSLAAALKAKGYAGTITGISSPDSLRKARDAGFIDHGYPHDRFDEGTRGANLIVLASPISTILENLDRLGDCVEDGAVVTDVGSTKSAVVEKAAGVLPDSVEFIGGHPMAGSEAKGISAADAYLYENAVWVLTPDRESDSTGELAALAESVGSKVVITDPYTHDLIAARISHLPQLLATTLMNVAGDWNEDEDLTLRLAAGGFRDLTRIASSPYETWSDIFETNRVAILESLDTLIRGLEDTREKVSAGTLAGDFERANLLRLSIPRDTRGFVIPLHDILVVVRDEPGVLATIAGCLAPHSINIRDIEVLKVREGEGGTMRLAFSTPEEAGTAVRLLAKEGLRSWVEE